MTPDFNKSAFALTPTQLGEWVFHELTRNTYDVRQQRYDHIRFLMAAGADPAWNTDMHPHVRHSRRGYTLAMAAASGLDVEALKILADFNVNLDTHDSDGMSPLLYTLWPRAEQEVLFAIKAALYLISKGVDVKNSQDENSPIVLAAGEGYSEVVEALIQAKADVNAKNSHGETALAAAVLKQKPDVVKLLLKAGADANWVSSRTGKTLVELAEARASELKNDAAAEVLQIIKEAAGKQTPPAPKKGPQP